MINDGNLQEAEDSIAAYEKEVFNDFDMLTMQATLSYLKGDVGNVIVLLRESYVCNPQHIDTIFNLGYMYKVDGNIKMSTYYFEKCIELVGQDSMHNEIATLVQMHLDENNRLIYGEEL